MNHSRVRLRSGVLEIDGVPRFLLSADYPYYRDNADRWGARLQKLRDLGIPIVTFYIPWRHHEVDGELDFFGRTDARRNVAGFLRLCQEAGLLAIVKPGPFVHAELDYGGLPDRLDPSVNQDIEPMLNAGDERRVWYRPLPAPLGAGFGQEVAAWLRAVRDEIILPFRYPDGPIVALQVLNEGIYSDGNRDVTEYDYAPSSLALFAQWQARLRGGEQVSASGAPPRAFQVPVTRAGARQMLDWARYQADYIGELYRRFGSELATVGLPLLTNQNPPMENAGLDWWLTRVNPERWPGVHYGTTNWVGVVSHDPGTFRRYLLLCKRAHGPNMEENWGFSELYDRRYRHPVIPFFQTVLALAAGATGFNVYTGVGTSGWDRRLDSRHAEPYPDTAPIGPDGSWHPKAQILRLLALYLNRWGVELQRCSSAQPVSWALYPPYSALASWQGPPEAWREAGLKPPSCGRSLESFMAVMRQANRDFGIVNVEADSPLSPATHPALALAGGSFMARAVQERLLAYVRAGGCLLVAGSLPTLDDDLETPCTILADGLKDPGAGRFRQLDGPIFDERFLARCDELGFPAGVETDSPETQAWIYRHPEYDVQHLFILSVADGPKNHRVAWDGREVQEVQEVQVTLPGRSAAILRMENGRLAAALIKGINECVGDRVVPEARCGEQGVRASGPCDLFWSPEDVREVYP